MFTCPCDRAAERVCDACSTAIERVGASESVLRMLLDNPYIDLRDLAVIKCVCVQARAAVDFLQKKWARLGQNWFDSTSAVDAVSATLLQQNAHLLNGHPYWEILVAAVEQQGRAQRPRSPETQNCWNRQTQRVRAGAAADTPAGVDTGADAGAGAGADVDVGAGVDVGADVDVDVGADADAGVSTSLQRRANCRLLRCHAWCASALTCGQCVAILQRLRHGSALRARAVTQLEQVASSSSSSSSSSSFLSGAYDGTVCELTPYVPTLVCMAVQDDEMLRRVVLPAAAKSDEFAFLAYFCARSHPTLWSVKERLLRHLSSSQAREVTASENLSSTLLQLLDLHQRSAACVAELAKQVTSARPFLPGSAQFRVVSVDTDTIARVQSSTQPWMLHCEVEDVHAVDSGKGQGQGQGRGQGRTQRRTLMIKSEGVWNDLVVMLVQRRLLNIDADLELEPYYVVPLGVTSGLVMFVKDCRSLYDIENDGSIERWLMSRGMRKTCEDVQRTFMRSCAVMCILSRLFGFGDRHLQNILCSGTSGRLVHIDFSYLWSEEPAMSRHRIWLPEQTMRLTPGMLGVFSENYYREFLDTCTAINRTARAAATDMYYICQALAFTGSATEATLQAHFTAFLMPYATNVTDQDAAIVNVIQHETKTEAGPLAAAAAAARAFFRYFQ